MYNSTQGTDVLGIFLSLLLFKHPQSVPCINKVLTGVVFINTPFYNAHHLIKRGIK